MKRIFSMLLALSLITSPVYAIDEWAKGKPAGTDSPSDIDTLIQTNNEALDRLMAYGRFGCGLVADTVAQLTVNAGSVVCSNSAGTVRRTRTNSSSTTVTWANIDTGSEATSTTYYVYAVADTDVATFTVKISTSSSVPSGATYYKKLGSFYNNASGNITDIINSDSTSSTVNVWQATGTTEITTTSTTYEDMTDMSVVVSGAGIYLAIFSGAIFPPTGNGIRCYVTIDIDGTDYNPAIGTGQNDGYNQAFPVTTIAIATLATGSHTFKVQWKVASGTGTQWGDTGNRTLTVLKIA